MAIWNNLWQRIIRSTANRQAIKNLKLYRDVLLNRQNEVKNGDKEKEGYQL
jgi:hypothetical protein